MFNFVVKPDVGEPYKLEATSRDVFLWEKTTKSNMAQLQNGMSMMAMYTIAHFAAKRHHMFTGTLNEFVDSNDLDFEAAPDADPTLPEVSADQ